MTILKEYWFNIVWSLFMLGIAISLTLSQGWSVSFFAYGLALLMSVPPIYAVFESKWSLIRRRFMR